MAELWVAQLGTVSYGDGVALQETLRERRQAGDLPDLLLVLEHLPVYTKGRRTEAGDLPMGESWYRSQGIDVCDTDRGGRVTYHGPGQLVAYPIMAVERVADFVHTMERAIVTALADEGIAAEPRATPFTGVWANDAQDRVDRGAGVGRGHHARTGRERGQRPPAVRVDRAVRHRPRAHDVGLEGDRQAPRVAVLPQAHGVALRRGVRAAPAHRVADGRILEREPVAA